MAVDALVRRHGLPAFRSKFQSAIAEGSVAGERVYVQKPQTYMNLSGDAVGEAARFYKIAPAEIAVIHDEIDQAIGEDFWRVRLGVGHPGVKELVHPYVLQNFDAEEMLWVTPLIDAVAEALPLLIKDDAPGFMTKVALILKPPPPKPPRPPDEKED